MRHATMDHHGSRRRDYAHRTIAPARPAMALALALVAACTTAHEPAASGRAHQAVISDALHNAGTPGFYFLPPVVPTSAAYGDFVALAEPTVTIDEIAAGDARVIRTVAVYTESSGPGDERVRSHLRGQPGDDGDSDPEGYFVVRWDTDRFDLSTSAVYRIRVRVPGRELGFADVDLVRTSREFRGVDRDDFVPLIDGRVLRIKFRIDRPAVDRDNDGAFDWRDNCPAVANDDQHDSLGNGVGDACRCIGVDPNDANPCTNDRCTATEGVVHVPGGAGVICRPALAGGCDIEESCDGMATVCPLDHFVEPGISCSNGNPCDGDETCGAAGACSPGVALPVDDGDPCTDDACDPTRGVTHAPSSGGRCEDGNLCTRDDVCAAGICVAGAAVTCTETECQGTRCEPTSGRCSPKPDGILCDDMDAATHRDMCFAGGCRGFPFVLDEDIAAGRDFVVLRSHDGRVWTFGDNAHHQLGGPSGLSSAVPIAVPGLAGVVDVAAGESTALAALSDGSVWTWGDERLAGLPSVPRLAPVRVSGLPPRVTAVAAGRMHSVALVEDGTVWAWGVNSYGALGSGEPSNRLALPGIVPGLGSVVAIAATGDMSAALTASGEVWVWGNNSTGVFGVMTPDHGSTPVHVAGLPIVRAIALGGSGHALALAADGVVWAWGRNDSAQLGDGTLMSRPAPRPVPGLTGVTAIVAGLFHNLATLADGTVMGWGDNSQGALAADPPLVPGGPFAVPSPRLAATRIHAVPTARAIGAGDAFSVALGTDGRLWTWGAGGSGQLGDNTHESMRVHPGTAVGFGRYGVLTLTQNNDTRRTGANLRETILNTSNVNTQRFGKLFSARIEGRAFAQPLYVEGLDIPRRGLRNVVFVATAANHVYAIDADGLSEGGVPIVYWHVGPDRIGLPVERSRYYWCADVSPLVGIIATPVIDLASSTIYFTAKADRTGPGGESLAGPEYYLHALDLVTGAARPGSPRRIDAAVAGNASDATSDPEGRRVHFRARTQMQRPGLLLQDGEVWMAFGGHCDIAPFHGWVMAYDARTLTQTGVYATTREGTAECTSIYTSCVRGNGSGIWQGGRGLASTGTGDVYFTTGNALSPASPPADLSNAVVRLGRLGGGALGARTWFVPSNFAAIDEYDADLASSGVLLVPHSDSAITIGKEAVIYHLRTFDFGGLTSSDTGLVQRIPLVGANPRAYVGPVHTGPVYWSGPTGAQIYMWPEQQALTSYRYEGGILGAMPRLNAASIGHGSGRSNLTISADGAAAGTGILWATVPSCGGSLVAYDAEDISRPPLWSSSGHPNDLLQFTTGDMRHNFPTIANGRVYIGTFADRLVVYGLLPIERPGVPPPVTCGSCAPYVGPAQPATWSHIYNTYLRSNPPRSADPPPTLGHCQRCHFAADGSSETPAGNAGGINFGSGEAQLYNAFVAYGLINVSADVDVRLASRILNPTSAAGRPASPLRYVSAGGRMPTDAPADESRCQPELVDAIRGWLTASGCRDGQRPAATGSVCEPIP